MPVNCLILVWFIFFVLSVIFNVVVNEWSNSHTYLSTEKKYPLWLIITSICYELYFCYSVVYTIVWLSHM